MVHKVKHQEDLEEQFKAAGDKVVVIDFFAVWCGPCKGISPTLEKFSQTYAANIVVLKVDVDECEEVAAFYNISSMPTFIFWKNGEILEQFSGANPDRLEKSILQHTGLDQ